MRILRLVVVSIIFSTPVFALVGDITIKTGHPYYKGEGQYQTVDDIIAYVLDPANGYCPASPTDQEKMIGMWTWLMEHVYHDSPADENFNYRWNTSVYDAMKIVGTYGFAICGTSSRMFCAFGEKMGYNARMRGISGHNVPEFYWGGDWHYIDHDMAGIVFQSDHSTLASVEEVAADTSLIDWDYRAANNWPEWPWEPIIPSCLKKGTISSGMPP